MEGTPRVFSIGDYQLSIEQYKATLLPGRQPRQGRLS
jgi:hypothetical protein